jgi:hypothetical protein
MLKRMLLLTAIISLLILNTIAQEGLSNKRNSVGIIAGGSYQTISQIDFAGQKVNNKFITGFHGGADVEFRISSHFYLRPGILYTTKGYSEYILFYVNPRYFTYRVSYIEMPVNLLFKQPLGKGLLLTGIGAYYAVALNGKINEEESLHFKNSYSTDAYYPYENLKKQMPGLTC